MAAPGRTSFVGRAGVLDTLGGLLEEARVGAGSAALLYGEAGIGKTRTLEEIAQRAAAGGFLVAWGHCTELDGVPPYWPWRGVFDALAVDSPDVSGGRAGVLTALVGRLDAVPGSGRSCCASRTCTGPTPTPGGCCAAWSTPPPAGP